MKKLIAFLLAVVMCVSLCACGGDNEPGETVSSGNNETVNGAPDTPNNETTQDDPNTETEGLVFELNEDGESYKLLNLGEFTGTVVTVPGTYEGKPVTAIDEYAFQENTTLTRVVIPEGVTEIPYKAFFGCTALESVELPDSVTFIGHLAFRDCVSLKSIVLPPNVTSLSATFEGCELLENVTLPANLEKLGERVFNNCHALKTIDIPASVLSIDHEAFARCEALTAVNFDSRYDGFEVQYSNETFPITDSAKMAEYLSSDYGWGCYGMRYTDESGLRYEITEFREEYCISLESAQDKTITSANIVSELAGYPVRVISESAFKNCDALISANIPASVVFVSDSAFRSCDSLQSVTFEDTTGWTIGYGDAVDVSDPAANVTTLKTTRTFLNHEIEPAE